MIRAKVNAEDFLRSILNVGDFLRQFKFCYYIINGYSQLILGNRNYVFRNAFGIFRNPFHCRYKELIIFIVVYFLLHCPPYSVFLCVCKVNSEEIFLYSMMLSPYLVSTIGYNYLGLIRHL